jgi:hypothetical protein
MLESLLKWLRGRGARDDRGPEVVARWAEARGCSSRGVKGAEGFIVEGRLGTTPWRLEWGPSQRPYVTGGELRLRAELALSHGLQVLVLNRPLAEAMEKTVYDQFIEGVQTRIDTTTPPEMRWLVMLGKVGSGELKGLRDRYAAVTSHKGWLLQWIGGPLAEELAGAPGVDADPVVLMIGRGRLTLRTGVGTPDTEALERWLSVFETAIREARRVHAELGEPAAPSTQPSLFNPSAMPGEPEATPPRK